VSSRPTVSIAIPTRARSHYLDVTLASIVPQADSAGAEVLVVSDGGDTATERVAQRHGVRLISLPQPQGLNAARNRAVNETTGELIVFVDDDVEAPRGWLEALLAGVRAAPDHDAFGGPIRARLEGGGPRACGREGAPITTLELGVEDRDVPLVWGANMAIRRRAFERVGRFDETLNGRGDEEDWERRYARQGGLIRYVAGAGLDHRRTAADATVRALASAGFEVGRTARRNDLRNGTAPSLASELRTLAGCAWHVVRRRCAIGIVLFAHTAGRLREAVAELRR
jgi:glycosyltransferase involved in cell wall biosynthesis